MDNPWKHAAESSRDTLESEAVWRANSAMRSEREKPVTYQTDKGLLLCQIIRKGGTFRAQWKLDGKPIHRNTAAQFMAERMAAVMTTPYKHLPQAARNLYDSFIRLDSDSYGNPRYYIPGFLLTSEQVKRGQLVKYRGKKYGPGYVAQSYYNLESLCELLTVSRKSRNV